jgi:hypothetical protein
MLSATALLVHTVFSSVEVLRPGNELSLQPPTPSVEDSSAANGETPAAGSPDARAMDARWNRPPNPEGRSCERP